MPLCISCRGEYWVPVEEDQTTQPQQTANAQPPWPDEAKPAMGPAAPSPGSGLAQVYDLDDLPPYVCARCQQSNERWHAWANASGFAHFSRFFFRSLPWGWLALSSFTLPALAAWLIDFTPVASERIGVPLAILLIFVNFALLYAVEDSLWRYDLLARVGRGPRPPLALLGVITFVMALICGLIIVFMLEAMGAGGHPSNIPIPMGTPAASTGVPAQESAPLTGRVHRRSARNQKVKPPTPQRLPVSKDCCG